MFTTAKVIRDGFFSIMNYSLVLLFVILLNSTLYSMKQNLLWIKMPQASGVQVNSFHPNKTVVLKNFCFNTINPTIYSLASVLEELLIANKDKCKESSDQTLYFLIKNFVYSLIKEIQLYIKQIQYSPFPDDYTLSHFQLLNSQKDYITAVLYGELRNYFEKANSELRFLLPVIFSGLIKVTELNNFFSSRVFQEVYTQEFKMIQKCIRTFDTHFNTQTNHLSNMSPVFNVSSLASPSFPTLPPVPPPPVSGNHLNITLPQWLSSPPSQSHHEPSYMNPVLSTALITRTPGHDIEVNLYAPEQASLLYNPAIDNLTDYIGRFIELIKLNEASCKDRTKITLTILTSFFLKSIADRINSLLDYLARRNQFLKLFDEKDQVLIFEAIKKVIKDQQHTFTTKLAAGIQDQLEKPFTTYQQALMPFIAHELLQAPGYSLFFSYKEISSFYQVEFGPLQYLMNQYIGASHTPITPLPPSPIASNVELPNPISPSGQESQHREKSMIAGLLSTNPSSEIQARILSINIIMLLTSRVTAFNQSRLADYLQKTFTAPQLNSISLFLRTNSPILDREILNFFAINLPLLNRSHANQLYDILESSSWQMRLPDFINRFSSPLSIVNNPQAPIPMPTPPQALAKPTTSFQPIVIDLTHSPKPVFEKQEEATPAKDSGQQTKRDSPDTETDSDLDKLTPSPAKKK